MIQTDTLVTTHMPLARRLARDFGRHYAPLYADDFESAAMLGLTEAAWNYRPGPRTFGTHATQRIRWRLYRCRRELFGGHDRYKPRVQAIHLDERIGVPDVDGGAARIDSADEFEAMLGLLMPPHRDLIRAMYGHDNSIREASAQLGIGRERARSRHRRALYHLRNQIATRPSPVVPRPDALR